MLNKRISIKMSLQEYHVLLAVSQIEGTSIEEFLCNCIKVKARQYDLWINFFEPTSYETEDAIAAVLKNATLIPLEEAREGDLLAYTTTEGKLILYRIQNRSGGLVWIDDEMPRSPFPLFYPQDNGTWVIYRRAPRTSSVKSGRLCWELEPRGRR